MNERERVAHVARKLGFGAPWAGEEPETAREAVDRMLAFDPAEELAWPDRKRIFESANGQLDSAGGPVQRFWTAQMLLTPHPLRQKLALFWHSWFAVSRDKVVLGPILLDYLQALRTKGAGRFEDLLADVALGPAMMLYLDLDQSLRGRPNENLARELLELFSLGIGNYSEQDVLEATRSLTGSGVIVSWRTLGKTDAERLAKYAAGEPAAYSYYSAGAHDSRPQTILGQTKDRTPRELVSELAAHTATRRRVCERLWQYFVREEPPRRAIERMEQAYTRTDGEIRSVLRAMTEAPEFWEPASVRSLPCSPADFTIGLLRRLRLDERLNGLVGEPIPDLPRRVLAVVHQRMARQGLELLAPEDVSGWRWGRAWFSPAGMAARFALKPLSIFGPRYDRPWCAMLQRSLADASPQREEDAVAWLLAMVDAPDDPALRSAVIEETQRRGLARILNQTDPFLLWAESCLQLVCACPAAHMV